LNGILYDAEHLKKLQNKYLQMNAKDKKNSDGKMERIIILCAFETNGKNNNIMCFWAVFCQGCGSIGRLGVPLPKPL
jgi:hypothetical protein